MNRDHSCTQSKQQSFDVDIVGGSAAGLFAAYLLARGGKRVRLFDANDVLHATPRTLITTAELSEVLGFFPDEAVVNRIRRIDLFSPGRSASVEMKRPDLVVERSRIVSSLAGKAAAEGVEIWSRCKLLNFEPAAGGARLWVQDSRRGAVEEIRTRNLIAADGAFSRVAQAVANGGPQTVPILQAIVALPSRMSQSTTQVWFRPQDTPYFYWLIPESPDRAAVGFIADEGSRARERLERFLSALHLKPLELQAARIPLYAPTAGPRRRLPGCDVYLVGDAGGQVKVTTVGGLVTGLRGARACAYAILGKENYRKELRSLRTELGLHRLIRTVLNRFRASDYDRLLDLLDRGTTRLLGMQSRDRAAVLVLRLLVRQPRLLSFAASLCRNRR